MSMPSFLYSGLGPDIRELNKYLDELGGGDARTADVELHCIINPIKISRAGATQKKEQSTLWKINQTVGLRDVKNRQAAAEENMKYFTASSIAVASTDKHVFDARTRYIHPTSPHSPCHREVSQWLIDGFNALTIAYGEDCTGKRSYMLGTSSSTGDAAYVPDVLSQLYQESDSSPLRIALSLWALRGNDIIDLCQHNTETHSHLPSFATIECPTLDIALKVIRAARQRCRDNNNKIVLVFRPDADDESVGTLSHLHVVDLIGKQLHRDHIEKLTGIGTQSTDTLQHRQLNEEDRIARREHNIQLQSLIKVLSEVRDISRSAALSKSLGGFTTKPTEQLKLTSARDSKLTLLLAPIIQGNAKTSLFLFLQDGESHYTQSLHTLCSFEGMTDITSACYRVHVMKQFVALSLGDVAFASLQCRHYDSVLSIDKMFPSARIPHTFDSDSEPDENSNEDDTPSPPRPVKKQQAVSAASTPAEVSADHSRSHFHTLKQEFNALMADLMQQAVESPDQSPMRRVKGGNDRNTLDYSSMYHRRLNAIHDPPPPVPQFLQTTTKHTTTTSRQEDENMLNDSLDVPPPPERDEYDWEKAWQEEDASDSNLDYAPQLTQDYWPTHTDYDDIPPPPRSTESPLNITPNPSRHRGISFDSPPAPRISLATTPSRRSEKESHESYASPAKDVRASIDRSSATMDILLDQPNRTATPATTSTHVNDSLLRTLHEEQQEKEQLLETVRRLEADLEEQRAAFDVERETYRVDEIRLKGQIRKLSSNLPIQDAVSVFEHDIERLTKENEFLKKRNIALEERLPLDSTPRKAEILWNLDGMTSSDGASKEMRVLRGKLKRAEKENAELTSKYEDLRKKERLYSITSSQLDDLNKKYKALHAEHQQLQQQLTLERTATSKKDADSYHLREELSALQFSERTLREERSRILSELALLRQRVREIDEDRRTGRSFDRFVLKHGSKSPNVNRQSENVADNISSVRDSFEALSGVNGLSNAIYTRPEEVEPLSIALEKALLTLQDNVAIVAPSLLPLVHKLGAEIRNERATSLEQKIQILQKYKNVRSQSPSIVKPRASTASRNAPKSSDSRYTDTSKLKF